MENRTDNKLKNVAKKLEGIIPDGSAQSVYDDLRQVMLSQKEYFETYSAFSILKLTIYIYSFKKTKNFDLANSIIDKLFFASLFATNNNIHKEECDSCDGGGYYNCDECDGTGNVECSSCDGNGTETCESCDGEGKLPSDDEDETWEDCDECNGKGETSCYNCAGDGDVNCNNCDGNGSESCHNCDGIGEIETGNIEYDVYEICSWDENLYNILEIKLDNDEPAISDVNFTKFNKSVIILNQFEDDDEFNIELEEDVYYCFGLNRKDEIDLKQDIVLMRKKFTIGLNGYIGNYLV
jgi:hypothetical protein